MMMMLHALLTPCVLGLLMAPQWSLCWSIAWKLVYAGAALAFLFLTGTQTAFGQHNLEADTDKKELVHVNTDLKHPGGVTRVKKMCTNGLNIELSQKI